LFDQSDGYYTKQESRLGIQKKNVEHSSPEFPGIGAVSHRKDFALFVEKLIFHHGCSRLHGFELFQFLMETMA
jgi:hypothetical protein